ncbi:MAG: PorT family protein [Bacteroidales bacterium]|nr:PorT family protein [Bacteroidales bacterium]
MKENEIDKIFRDKLAEFETPVEQEVWGAIESTLNSQMPAGGRKVHFLSRQIYYYIASAAAVILLLIMLVRPESDRVQIEDKIAVVEQTPYCEQTQTEDNSIAINKEAEICIAAEGRQNMIGSTNKIQDADVAWSVNVNETAGENADENVTENEASVVAETSQAEETSEMCVERVEEYQKPVVSDYGYTAYETVKKRSGKEYSFSLASNFISSSSMSISPQYLNYMSIGSVASGGANSVEQISQTQYSLPINVALQAQVKINDLLQIGVGLSYTMLRSKYEVLINKQFYRVKQNLNYIGVPLNLYFTFIGKKNFSLYANVGGSVERGVGAIYKLNSYDATSYRKSVKMEGFIYSSNVGFGMEYRFIPEIGLYLEPNVVYYFNSEMPASIRTDQPLQIKAEVGFRFHLNNK